MGSPIPPPHLPDGTGREPVQPGAATVSSPPSTVQLPTRPALRPRAALFLAVLTASVAVVTCLALGVAARYAGHADAPDPPPPEARWVSLAPGQAQRVVIRSTAAPDNPPPAQPDPWVFGVTGPELQAWMDSLPARGLCPSYLSVQAGGDPSRFNAIAVRDDRPNSFRFDMALEPTQMVDTLAKWHGDGYPPRTFTHYQDSGRVLMAVLGIRDHRRYGYWHTSINKLRGRLDEYKSDGPQRPAGFGVLLTGSGLRLTVSMGYSTGARWEAHLSLSAGQLSALEAEQRVKGGRIELVYAYRYAESLWFVAVAVANPKNEEWAFRDRLTADELQQAVAAEKKRGLRPVAVTSYSEMGDTRYTAVWGRDGL